MMWEWLVQQYQIYVVPLLLGAWWTIALCVVSAFLASLLGLVTAFARMSPNRLLKFIGKSYIDIIRGTPLLLQLFYIYYALPTFGIVLPAYIAGVIGLTLGFGAYLAEVYRSGIQSIESGQHDAARSLGLGWAQRFRFVVLPQAFRVMYPTLANYALVIIKDSSLVAIIGVYELMHAGQLLSNSTFEPIKVFTIVGIMYLAISSVVARLFGRGEAKLAVPGYWGEQTTNKTMRKGKPSKRLRSEQ